MNSPSVFVGMPVYDGIHPQTFVSIWQTLALSEASAIFQPGVVWGCALLGYARARLVAKFLETDHDYLLWLDADIAFPPETITKLLGANVEMIGAACAYRGGLPAPVLPRPLELQPDANGVAEVEWIGTGLTLWKRSVVTKLVEAHPELMLPPTHRESTPLPNGVEPDILPFLFHPTRPNISEDIAVCERWRSIGGKCHALLDCETAHFGETMHRMHGLRWLQHARAYGQDLGFKAIMSRRV